MSQRAHASSAVSERWQGFMLRNGLQVPIAVELAADSADWTGRFRVGNSSLPLEHVRVTGLGVHFELPGEGAFDGTVAGSWMAGSVSGSAAGRSEERVAEGSARITNYKMPICRRKLTWS